MSEGMAKYKIVLTGTTPLLMHNDNLVEIEKIEKWRKDPANKEYKENGDDRSPCWTWLSYIYHDGRILGVSSDNIMTMLREGGAKVINKGKETYKKQTQAGIMCEEQQFSLSVPKNGDKEKRRYIPIDKLVELRGNMDFATHIEVAELLGFELFVKRAKIGSSKHIRVRPMFGDWRLTGHLIVIDEGLSGITEQVLTTILNQAGALCGLCDWRPSSPKSSGTFGKFRPVVKRVDF